MFLHFDSLLISIIIIHFFQGYTNTDNPFGDAHLLENFVWQKVRFQVTGKEISVLYVMVTLNNY